MYVVELPFNKIARLHFAASYRIKNSTIDSFLELLRKSKFQKSIWRAVPFL